MPAPFMHGSRPPESLASHITDLANAFSDAALVLSQQYTDLNNATNGLLDGTYPWQGKGASSFSDTWQVFGSYMQQLQKACEDTHNSLSKFSSKLSDIESQQVWDFLLMVVGGILTVVSFAAMIAELGLNPFVDGFFGLISTFTEQDGAAVFNASEEITQADSEAATELQIVEEELTTSPIIMGSGPVGNTPAPISPVHLDEMMLTIDEQLGQEGQQLIENELGTGSNGDGAFPLDQRIPYEPTGTFYQQLYPGSCIAASTRMVLSDFDVSMPESYIRDAVGVDALDGGTIKNVPQGLKDLGLETPAYSYQENLTTDQLGAATKNGPAIISLKLGPQDFHAVVVDSVQDGVVYIRDPAGSSYAVTIQDFLNLWNGKAVIPGK